MWKDLDSGLTYILNEATGEQVECDTRGIPVKPFNPKITGRYNFDDRKRAIEKSKADVGPIDLPH
jgi:hypothetical protein